MTVEEAREILKYIKDNLNDSQQFARHDEAIDVAIKALEQEDILEKIVAEIEDTGAYEQEVNGETEYVKGITYCLNIIDKYKAESEE